MFALSKQLRASALIAVSVLAISACTQKPQAATEASATAPKAALAEPLPFDPRLVQMATTAATQAIAEAKTKPVVAGKDYDEIANGQPFQPLDGKVEVVEVFAYSCPHCADFEPLLEAWTKQQPANVRVMPLPLAGGVASDLGRTYFAAVKTNQLQGIHTRMFYGIHGDKSLPAGASGNDIAAWLGKQGYDGKTFRATMASPEVQQQMQQAHDFELRSGVDSTPTLIVNGKYRIKGSSQLDDLRIASTLIARESGAGK
ncbi:thiol:disulfide interchange protein DsbA/DsbL [Solilutibacter silvestris]|uniref:Thiol:disulfide interchange protein DsbA n=1 Tax=Solilutibacter silvestris TaxID=1645665 RepID=A0A2K1Q1N0_9GAMM|nr:thiol:disulfide interchange protein DsbA/DsbL [Lysobacter silvestris]PNS08934.1 Thioredoxin [Lysobacter silvestris]